jgi:hypothetical protein
VKIFLKVQSGCRFSCYIGSGAKEKGGTVPLKKLLGKFLKWTLPVIFKCYDQTIPTGKEEA